jgi:hypothetical protein
VVARGGERTRVLSISFIFSFFHHFTAEPQRLPELWLKLKSMLSDEEDDDDGGSPYDDEFQELDEAVYRWDP